MRQPSGSAGRGTPPLPPEGEVQPLPEFIRTMLRYVPAITAFMALCVAATFFLTSPDDGDSRTASTEVGLTRRVVWPFYDATRERVQATVIDPGFFDEVTNTVGGSGQLTDLDVEIPESQAFVRVVAVGTTREAAVEGANQAAELLLARDIERMAAVAQADLAVARANLDASLARVADMDGRLEELVAIESQAEADIARDPTASGPRETLLATEIERSSTAQVRNEELRRQVELQMQVDEASVRVDQIIPELEILGRADADDAESRSAAVLAGAAAGSLILGLAMAAVWDRTRGRVSSRWHAEQLARVPVIGDVPKGETVDSAVALVASRLLEATYEHGRLIGMSGVGEMPVEGWIARSRHHLERAGVRVFHATAQGSDDPGVGSGSAVRLSDLMDVEDLSEALAGISSLIMPMRPSLVAAPAMRATLRDVASYADIVIIDGGTAGQGDSEYAALLADATALVARKGVTRVPEVREAARYLSSAGSHVLGVVLDAIPVLDAPKAAAAAAPRSAPDTSAKRAKATT